MKISRRDFVKHTSLAIAASAFAESQTSNRLPMAFSNLGGPQWDLPHILNFAERHGFAAIELRGLQGSLDLPTHAAFSDKSIAQTKRDIAAHGLRIACVSSSANMQQAHDVKNLFVMDASGFTSNPCQNPTLTIMALCVRSCDYLMREMKIGSIA